MSDKGSVWMGLLWASIFCLLAAGAGLGTGYVVDMKRRAPDEPEPVTLAAEYDFSGPVKPSHLAFTRKEILRLNATARSACSEFRKIDVRLAPLVDQDLSRPDTLMKMEIRLQLGSDSVIRSWGRKVKRRMLVRRLERTVALGMEEMRRSRESGRSFKTLYI
ncbi:hypothetical protein [Pseudodesulfovibrio senegalensis]|uniref:Uncharacterized protein n=1 Tax=Pseudodesulfovibrio senegalensis TaxID=1721087 RepID=A0A6N6N3T5_9BACT|nr:hypothetical protein [Pseudodesulfovibrio senegalensis]KAB1442842.1 hypothetical protein F8A88_00775 [Pseudodesulfovibrio senegalensis]